MVRTFRERLVSVFHDESLDHPLKAQLITSPFTLHTHSTRSTTLYSILHVIFTRFGVHVSRLKQEYPKLGGTFDRFGQVTMHWTNRGHGHATLTRVVNAVVKMKTSPTLDLLVHGNLRRVTHRKKTN